MNDTGKPKASGARTAWMGVGAPILGLVTVIIVLTVATFGGFANELDRAFERSSSRLVASATEGRATALASVTLDYTNWNQAFDAVTTQWDPRWIEANIYSSVADGMIIVRPNGAVRYAWFADPELAGLDNVREAAVAAAIAVPDLRRLARASDPAGIVARTYALVGGQLLIVTVAPFTREDDAERMARAPISQDYLALVDVVTADELLALGASIDLQALNFRPAGASAGDDTVVLPVVAADGEAVGALEWRHKHPGPAAFQDRLWPVILALLLIGALTALIARFAVERQVRALARASAAMDSSRSKSEFLARVSQELRTPLAAIVGYAEMIEEEAGVSTEARTDAGHILTAARLLGHLINDIIDQSRIDAGRIKFNPEALPVAGIVAEVQGMIRPAANTARVKFTATSDPIAGFVFADHVRLRQCLLNLLSNAVKFARGGAVVLRATLDSSGEQPMVVFAVQDDGIGMSEAEIENIFRPFGQANAAIGESFGGAGLGLSLAREIARGMGGDITVVSEQGAGSTFSLIVPAATARALRAA